MLAILIQVAILGGRLARAWWEGLGGRDGGASGGGAHPVKAWHQSRATTKEGDHASDTDSGIHLWILICAKIPFIYEYIRPEADISIFYTEFKATNKDLIPQIIQRQSESPFWYEVTVHFCLGCCKLIPCFPLKVGYVLRKKKQHSSQNVCFSDTFRAIFSINIVVKDFYPLFVLGPLHFFGVGWLGFRMSNQRETQNQFAIAYWITKFDPALQYAMLCIE